MPIQIRLLKRAIVQILTGVVLLVLVFIGYVAWSSHRGENRAIAACAELPLEMSLVDARTHASHMVVIPRLLMVSDDLIAVGFEGAFADRWFCNVRFVDGNIAEHEIRLLD